MASVNPTSVNLAPSAQVIKDDLAPVFGLGDILSAGLILFSRLSDAEQKSMIAEVNGYRIKDPAELAAHEMRLCIKKYQSLDEKDIAVSLQFLSDQESRATQAMLTNLNPALLYKEGELIDHKTKKTKPA